MLCNKCSEDKTPSEFYNDRRIKNGKQGICRICQIEYNRNSIKRKEYNCKYGKGRLSTPEGRDKCNKTHRDWYKRHKINPMFKLKNSMGSLMYHCLRDIKANRKWEKLAGYSADELVQHLEKQFDENMNWDNYGSYWHVDHIKPSSSFKYSSVEDTEFKKCWSLENLQPLERVENILKSNKLNWTGKLTSDNKLNSVLDTRKEQ